MASKERPSGTMIKIAHFGDLHINGKNYERIKECLKQISLIINEENCDLLVVSGDIYDRYNIADRYANLGDQQSLFLDFLKSIPDVEAVLIAVGNHELSGTGKSALAFLKAVPKVRLYEKTGVFIWDSIAIGIIPWIAKWESENKKFDEYIQSSLEVISKEFTGNFDHKLIFGHCDLQGTQANEYYVVQGGSWAFTRGELVNTGADYISLSHIHKRTDMYVGAPCQHSFGESGNPQGFDIVTLDGDSINEKYHELDLPKYVTIVIDDDSQIGDIPNEKGDFIKLRFNSESAYEKYCLKEDFDNEKFKIEKNWQEKKYEYRLDGVDSEDLNSTQIFNKYVDLNPVPAGISIEDVQERDQINDN